MTCNHHRELVSAAIDQQLSSDEQQQLDGHLAECAPCTAYSHDAWVLHRSFNVRGVTQQTLVADAPTTSRLWLTGDLGTVSALRWVLCVIGATLVILNMQALLTTGESSAAHISRHDGVFGTALGIGMLAVAAKPHRAMGLVPLTSTIALLMTLVAVLDLTAGNTAVVSEAIHLVEFAGLICLWVVSGGPNRLAQHLDRPRSH